MSRGRRNLSFLRNPGKTFWFEVLPDRKALYAQVNAVQDGETETLAAFSARMVAAARAAGAERIVLDLRLNGGGNNYLGRGLVLALIGAKDFNRYGRLFTIIGRNTFSAAVSLVSALERWSETIFVGEPTGNVPSQYGDSRRYLLPQSGLTVRLSSVYWRDAEVNERRPWVAADIVTGPAWADYAAGRDSALDAALAYEAPASLLDQLKEKFKWGGMRAAASHYYKHRNSPDTAAVRTDGTLLAMADFLFAQKDPGNAIEILRRAVDEYPDAAPCHLVLGKRLVERGDGEGALEPLKKALALKPGDPEAAAWLRKAEALVRAKSEPGPAGYEARPSRARRMAAAISWRVKGFVTISRIPRWAAVPSLTLSRHPVHMITGRSLWLLIASSASAVPDMCGMF